MPNTSKSVDFTELEQFAFDLGRFLAWIERGRATVQAETIQHDGEEYPGDPKIARRPLDEEDDDESALAGLDHDDDE